MPTVLAPPPRTDFSNKQFRRKELLIELSMFLFLIAPSMVLSFFFGDKSPDVGFTFTAVSNIFRDLALVGLVLFFLWRNGEPVSTVGWSRKSVGKEVSLGVGLFIPFFIGVGAVQSLLEAAGFSALKTPPPQLTISGNGQVALALVLLTVVAVSEETIFRGYLISRFGALTGNIAASVFLSALVFSLGHGYEGTAGVITVGVVGLFLGAVYIWRKSLVAPVVMHFLLNFISLIILPLLKHS